MQRQREGRGRDPLASVWTSRGGELTVEFGDSMVPSPDCAGVNLFGHQRLLFFSVA